ncbi:hypothetical protein [Pantoea agglomerans]|uniref:hypothetical protein n=1 Tax=Enterobacter agglomerans TaxID=549 RepID=UPI0013BCA45F|nr:hypothetical protein [Pantoea agglomerans]NEG59750.1 hypothetical protein [Pantoea agglomerans]NEH00803.1 hypothetical protein [Pantoea agglomerans]NEH16309.1 hypothetical protein [Pantoea agglomerans]
MPKTINGSVRQDIQSIYASGMDTSVCAPERSAFINLVTEVRNDPIALFKQQSHQTFNTKERVLHKAQNNIPADFRQKDLSPEHKPVSFVPKGSQADSAESSSHGHLFAFIRETYLEEAQEFRLKGYNIQQPKIDRRLLTQLRGDLAAAKARQRLQVNIREGLSTLLLDQISNIECLTSKLSDDVIKHWVECELSRKGDGEATETAPGSRRKAQSLARRLESTLQTLISVVRTLSAMDDYSTPEKRHDMLVAELTGAFSSIDKSTIIQALGSLTAETSGHAAWVSLMQARAAAWEAGKWSSVRAMIADTRHEAEKASTKARQLQGEPQKFFSDVAACLQRFSGDLVKASIHAGLSTTSPAIPQMNINEAAASLSRSNSLPQRIRAGFDKKKLQAQTAVVGMKVHAHRLVRIAQHGHLTGTPAKPSEHIVADSIIRSILWQWQQPAIKIQYASAALLSKVDELKKIEGILASYSVADERGSERERRNTPVSPSGEEDLVARVREWVNDSLEQETPENQRAVKVATLERLLGGDIDYAQSLLVRLGSTTDSIQKALERQWMSVNDMLEPLLPAYIARSLQEKVDHLRRKFMPDMGRDLAAAAQALNEATLAAGDSARNFSGASVEAGKAQLLATKVKESLSAESARLTESPLDEHSRGARLARHWAKLASAQNEGNNPPPDARQVLASLKALGLLAGTLSAGDPAGYLFATRLAGELENARHDELRLPVSPEQYAALEKGLVEYIVKWGQKRIPRGVTRIVIELSFEQALNAVSFNVFGLFRLPYKVLKATIKIPYNVNKVNNYTMPGHDKPYKAIYGLLGKKLKQLGFNLLTAPVPAAIKLAAGTGLTAGAALHNAYVGRSENTFSAVYQHVAEGKKSEKIKMGSVAGMIFDSVLDTATATAFKGAQRGWQSGRSEHNIIPGNVFTSESDGERNEETPRQAQGNETVAGKGSPVAGNVRVNQREAVPVSHSSSLQQQADIKPSHDERESGAGQPHVRRKRAAAPTFPQWQPDIRYQDFSPAQKKQTYFNGIQFILLQIENDGRFSQEIRTKAYLARIGASILVPVDILGYRLNNTIFLPDSPGARSGVLIRLGSEVPYYYVSEGRDLLENVKWAMPHNADKRRTYTFMSPDGRGFPRELPSGTDILDGIRSGKLSFEKYFNYNNPEPMDIANLSAKLADTIEADYKLKGKTITNRSLISRAIAGAYIPDSDVTATEVKYHLEFTWDNLTPAEYLRSFSRPFSVLSGQLQLVSSSVHGETIQETEQHVHQAEYTGSWADATVGTITVFTPAGWAFSTAQAAAAIGADLAEGKDPEPLAVAGLVVGCIPEGKIAAKVGKFTRIGGKAVKYGLMLDNKIVDLAIVGESIGTAVETGEPLAIYQAFLSSGMSVRSSYDMAKNMSSQLKIGKRIKDSASLEELEAVYHNIPDASSGSAMTARKFRIGQTYMLGRINNGEIEISGDNGATWQKGSKLHLLAYRLQNAGKFDSFKDKLLGTRNTTGEPDIPVRAVEPAIAQRTFQTQEGEDALSSRTKDILKTNMGRVYDIYLSSPRENYANAAVSVAEILRKNGYENVHIMEMGIWPDDGPDTMPANHYVVSATKDGINMTVDLTAGQFERYGFNGPLILSTDNWISLWQEQMKNSPRTLVKLVPLTGDITTSPFSMDYTNSQLTVPNGTLLQRPDWYKGEAAGPVIHPEQPVQRADLPAENAQPTLAEHYDSTRGLNKKRNHISFKGEVETNTTVVTDELNKLFQDYVEKNPVPLDAEGKPKCTVSVIGFGSLGRKELLLVSDIDIQVIVVADEKHASAARTYAKEMLNSVKSEWSKVRETVNNDLMATALELDSIGGDDGILVVDSPQAAAELMKPKKMGSKGYSDIYADSRPVYESEHGTYRALFDEYEAKLQSTAVNGLVNEALADLGALPKILNSAKQTFIRPISLAVGGLYRKLRAKMGNSLSYETNTLKRAAFLKEHGIINDDTYKNIEEVLLRAFKWEQEAGLENFRHGQQVLSSRASSATTRKMYDKTYQIQRGLTAANDNISHMPTASLPL